MNSSRGGKGVIPHEELAVEAVRRAERHGKYVGVKAAIEAAMRALDVAERDFGEDLTRAKRALAQLDPKEIAWPGRCGLT